MKSLLKEGMIFEGQASCSLALVEVAGNPYSGTYWKSILGHQGKQMGKSLSGGGWLQSLLKKGVVKGGCWLLATAGCCVLQELDTEKLQEPGAREATCTS